MASVATAVNVRLVQLVVLTPPPENTKAKPTLRSVFRHAYPSYNDMDMEYPYVGNWKNPRFSKFSAEVIKTAVHPQATGPTEVADHDQNAEVSAT